VCMEHQRPCKIIGMLHCLMIDQNVTKRNFLRGIAENHFDERHWFLNEMVDCKKMMATPVLLYLLIMDYISQDSFCTHLRGY